MKVDTLLNCERKRNVSKQTVDERCKRKKKEARCNLTRFKAVERPAKYSFHGAIFSGKTLDEYWWDEHFKNITSKANESNEYFVKKFRFFIAAQKNISPSVEEFKISVNTNKH